MTTRATTPTSRTLRVRARAEVAAGVIAPYYGLDAAIAVNPVLPALGDGFAAAIEHAVPAVGARGTLSEQQFRARLGAGRITVDDLAAAIRRGDAVDSAQAASNDDVVAQFLAAPTAIQHREPVEPSPVDELLARWCRAALAPEAAAWPVPVDQLGFYRAWRAVARHDLSLPRAVRRRIAALPESADGALAAALDHLEVHDDAQLTYLRTELSRLPGWAAYVRWRAMTTADVDVIDLLAVRAGLTWALDRGVDTPSRPLPEPDAVKRSLVWQEAFETAAHRRVLQQLRWPDDAPTAPVAAHLVFCIDPRSEGMRRHLEGQGPYATSGFAGFFGIAALVEPLAASEPSAACPVLLTPRYLVAERPMPDSWRSAARFVGTQSTRRALRAGLKAPDSLAGAPLGWAEATGWVLGPAAIARSLLAGRAAGQARPDDPASDVPTLFDIDSALTPGDQFDTAEVILRTMGMVENFAPIVAFIGHGTSTTNNVFRTALDCGACGGHRGAPNARIAAALLNNVSVRAALAERGISIPDDTIFIAGEHDTATDAFTILDLNGMRVDRRAEVQKLVADAAKASHGLTVERAGDLPGASAAASQSVARRSRDWAQVYPEWGLVRNAALIIGPRSLSVDADLGRRVFLHSYEPDHDPDGTALETILTAPLVVAHWINAQYYFSSVDPDVFGAGSKTVHNLVGGAGVLTGPSGDLRLGLPWQSIGTREGLHHEPVRLLVVVDAPRERIERIVQHADVVNDLVHGEWVILVRPGQNPGEWERCTAAGWQPWMSELNAGAHTPGAEEKEAA